jgi:hypothetical protein
MAFNGIQGPEVMGFLEREGYVVEPVIDGVTLPRQPIDGRKVIGDPVTLPEISDSTLHSEVRPRMTREAVDMLGNFIADRALVHPGTYSAYLIDSTGEQDVLVAKLADPQPRISIEAILADFKQAPERLKTETERLGAASRAHQEA